LPVAVVVGKDCCGAQPTKDSASATTKTRILNPVFNPRYHLPFRAPLSTPFAVAQVSGSKGLPALGGWVREGRALPLMLWYFSNQGCAHAPRSPKALQLRSEAHRGVPSPVAPHARRTQVTRASRFKTRACSACRSLPLRGPLH
jgi:hypothetical protein